MSDASWHGLANMVKLQEQVSKLEALASSDERFRLAYLLVGESGGNILRSFVAAGESADQVLEDG
ncbi:MAG: hypothetical protein IPJ38_11180 [Dechloromonas sp.]|uniref:Uncharacterized protein n=1 Tax=Candidatus Dechloromonas phosphorivorans TaxID=2899244 RepID=A0A935JXL9_9RHOO|nr:hypothetical protein [Candidatus Dechloromonas phosphorivorans]